MIFPHLHTLLCSFKLTSLFYLWIIIQLYIKFIASLKYVADLLLKLAYNINQSKYNSGRPTFKQQIFHSKVN